MGEMSADAGAYFGALVNSKTLMLVALVEIVAGLALIFNKFGALLVLIFNECFCKRRIISCYARPRKYCWSFSFTDFKYSCALRIQRQIQ